MSNVQECIDLYLTDEHVSDLWFRAMLRNAHATDQEDGTGEPQDMIRAQLAAHGHALVLLNRVDDVRRDQIEALLKRNIELTGFLDVQTGQIRVLRERLDNLEGK